MRVGGGGGGGVLTPLPPLTSPGPAGVKDAREREKSPSSSFSSPGAKLFTLERGGEEKWSRVSSSSWIACFG